MKALRSIFTANRNFFIGFLFFFITGLVFLLAEGKAAAFLYLNPIHRTTLDTFFVFLTFLGNGLFPVIVFVIFLVMRRWSAATQVMTSFLLSALLTQLLKSYFSMPRPKQFFLPGQYAYFIDGITNVGFASFPSGHSTTVFALATMMALLETNKKANIVYLLVAVAVGYSRIYLGQHFLGDVLMGSVIGTVAAIVVHWLFTEKFRFFN
jgi:membrane-associated phospholipid phosphatase